MPAAPRMPTKVILCFANSWKRGGTCVAGKELTGQTIGSWIRPVSARPTDEISAAERRYSDGTYADILDVIEIPMTRPAPSLHQTENHIIDSTSPWKRRGVVTWSQIRASTDSVPDALWLNGYSTLHGENDKIPHSLLAGIPDSLKLIEVADLTLHVVLEAGWQGAPARRKVRGSFSLNGIRYLLAITDPLVTQTYGQNYGNFPIGSAILCLSLSAPEYGHGFKLIASVFTAHRCGAAR